MDYVRVQVDEENSGEAWWTAADQKAGECFAFGNTLLEVRGHMHESVLVPVWWLEQARALPGWSDGPTYAPHPLIVHGTGRRYWIRNRTSGADMGVYFGADATDAVLNMVHDGDGSAGVDDPADWIVLELEEVARWRCAFYGFVTLELATDGKGTWGLVTDHESPWARRWASPVARLKKLSGLGSQACLEEAFIWATETAGSVPPKLGDPMTLKFPNDRVPGIVVDVREGGAVIDVAFEHETRTFIRRSALEYRERGERDGLALELYTFRERRGPCED
jgi:hypothetical protein